MPLSSLAPLPSLACLTCDPGLQARVFSPETLPLLAALALQWLVIAALAVGLHRLR